ncbi:hypothetical protein ONA91_38745 [Micromonospora sp. DR5-3]|uniref:hypothetical protein n=1 Tax=unclassified Micromonospora TaxID=2617518 RepID=UPI0011DADEB9|nr:MULTISPECIES: hypothetical protein [unclassified Micromonospora]MCW3820387.1 hypothetical protein [Micromonospora sp. DR5-3]TYC26156.1 hypothetical protein FXF52_02000 [Micromonospora sp. MP36]
MTTRTARVATALLGGAAALLTLAAPATAATATARPSITAQQLDLTPTDRGYVGTMTATVTNPGSTATSVDLVVTEPAGASFTTIEPGGPCFYERLVENRLVTSCYGGRIEAGASLTFQLGFQVWTTARDYPMVSRDGRIAVVPAGATDPSDTARFTTLFESTTGSVRSPRTYVQATETDLTIRGEAVVLTRQADGSLLGRMPVTVRYGNDAPSFHLNVNAALPAGVIVHHIEPQDMPSFPDSFVVPGGRFMPGEERTFDVYLSAPAGTPAGALGTGSYTLSPSYFYGSSMPGVDPADNTTSFPVTAVEAG